MLHNKGKIFKLWFGAHCKCLLQIMQHTCKKEQLLEVSRDSPMCFTGCYNELNILIQCLLIVTKFK